MNYVRKTGVAKVGETCNGDGYYLATVMHFDAVTGQFREGGPCWIKPFEFAEPIPGLIVIGEIVMDVLVKPKESLEDVTLDDLRAAAGGKPGRKRERRVRFDSEGGFSAN